MPVLVWCGWLCPEESPLCLHPRAADAKYQLMRKANPE